MTTILVLCTGNSARSILGEAILNHLGAGRITAYSAGSKPKGMPHSGALRLLARKGIDTSAFRAKSWDEFAVADSPAIDIAITVCGNAAEEVCPLFIGAPIRTHWGLSDPAAVTGSDAEIDTAFAETWRLLEMRARALLALPFEAMKPAELRKALTGIGQMEGAV